MTSFAANGMRPTVDPMHLSGSVAVLQRTVPTHTTPPSAEVACSPRNTKFFSASGSQTMTIATRRYSRKPETVTYIVAFFGADRGFFG